MNHTYTFNFRHIFHGPLEWRLLVLWRVNPEILRPAIESPVSFVHEGGLLPVLGRTRHGGHRVIEPQVVFSATGPEKTLGHAINA